VEQTRALKPAILTGKDCQIFSREHHRQSVLIADERQPRKI